MEALSNRDSRANLQLVVTVESVPESLTDSLDNHWRIGYFRPSQKDKHQQIISGAIGAEQTAGHLWNCLYTKPGVFLCFIKDRSSQHTVKLEWALWQSSVSWQEYAIKYLVSGKRHVIVSNIAKSSILVITDKKTVYSAKQWRKMD